MKKKIIFLCVVFVTIILAVVIYYQSTHRSINLLMTQFENAINSEDKTKLLNCYPDFLNDKLDNYISEDYIKEFHNNVGDICVTNINVVSTFDLSDMEELESEIQTEYDVDISLGDYQFITFSYHYDFNEATMQVIKIKNKYYLYTGEALQAPVGYFVE